MPRPIRPPRPSTLLLKLTPGVQHEAAALAAGLARRDARQITPRSVRQLQLRSAPGKRLPAAGLIVIRDARHPDRLSRGGRTMDLASSSGRQALTTALGLDDRRARALQQVLRRADDDSRDELAQLARVLRRCEQGQLQLRSVVLSGHYAAGGIRGEATGPQQNGTLTFASLAAVVRLFPTAARQVRHLMLASCWGARARLNRAPGDEQGLDSYRTLFPELLDVTAYDEKAPASHSPQARRHLRRWARATAAAAESRPIRRRQVFGRCRPHPPRPTQRTAHREHHGVVFSPTGAERCPPGR